MTRRRFGLSGGKKVVLTIVGLFIAWQFLNLPEMIDAFLTFCLAGVVPGTDIVLSPETVMKTAGITIGAIIALLALRPIVRSFFGKKRHGDDVATLPEGANALEADGITGQPSEPVITPAQAFRSQTLAAETAATVSTEEPAAQRELPAWMVGIGNSISAVLEKVMPRLLTLLVRVAVSVRPHILRALAEARKVAQAVKARAIVDFWWAVALAKRFWRWLVPYLWQLDGWLEVKFRMLESRVKHKVEQHDTAVTVVDLSRHAKKAIAETKVTHVQTKVQTKVKKAAAKAKPYASKAKTGAKKAHATAKKARSKAKTAASKARSRTQKQK